MLSGRSLKLPGAELRYCLTLSPEPGLYAQRGSNGSSVCNADRLIAHLKPVQGPTDLNTMTALSAFSPRSFSSSSSSSSYSSSSLSIASLISEHHIRAGIYLGDFGAELNSALTLGRNGTSQMVQDRLRTEARTARRYGCIQQPF